MHLYETWAQADADAQHERLDAQRGAFARFPMIAAMKAAVAVKTDRKDWVHLRPPLVELDTQ